MSKKDNHKWLPQILDQSSKTLARSLGGVGDLEPMNEKAGEDKDRNGETEQAEDSNERRDWFSDYGKDSHGTIDGQFDGAEMIQIESDAEMLCPGGKDGSDRFPSHQHNSRDDGIFEKQAESEKDRTIAETSESRDEEVGT